MTKDNFRLNGLEMPTHEYKKNTFSEYAVHSYVTNDFMKILKEIL